MGANGGRGRIKKVSFKSRPFETFSDVLAILTHSEFDQSTPIVHLFFLSVKHKTPKLTVVRCSLLAPSSTIFVMTVLLPHPTVPPK